MTAAPIRVAMYKHVLMNQITKGKAKILKLGQKVDVQKSQKWYYLGALEPGSCYPMFLKDLNMSIACWLSGSMLGGGPCCP